MKKNEIKTGAISEIKANLNKLIMDLNNDLGWEQKAVNEEEDYKNLLKKQNASTLTIKTIQSCYKILEQVVKIEKKLK